MNDCEFQKLYKRFFSLVFKHANFLLGGDMTTAEDITQETFIKLYTHPPVTQDNLAGWLIKVSSHLAFNWGKSRKKSQARENRVEQLKEMPEHNPPEASVMQNEEVLAVKEVLDILSERDRSCLLLKFSGFSYKEIADITGVEKNSLGTVLARAQARFKNEYISRKGGNG